MRRPRTRLPGRRPRPAGTPAGPPARTPAGAPASRLVVTTAAALGARAAWAVLGCRPPGGAARWQRTNHRGEPLTLLEGPAWVAGGLSGLAAVGRAPRTCAATALAVTAGGFFGALDDLGESGSSKGLRGHLGALAQGRLTTGALKLLGIGASSVVAAGLVATDHRAPRSRCAPARSRGLADTAARTLVGGALVAGTANLVNLLDLRPGRALKATLLAAPLLADEGPAGDLAAAALGASVALLPEDLAERAMLGDTGANAAGALLGMSLVTRLGVRGQAVALGVVAGLTLASEKVSFTRVIAATPVLRHLDEWGRRPQ